MKPRLSFWEIWNMSFGFLGIQFGFALQNANVSRIFETLGASIDSIPILWLAAPVTGLIVQPIIGHLSDNTWTRLGRRRPFFLIGAILASIALLIMPNSPELWIAAGMLWIMDASINISMEPFRAFVGDMLPSEQRTRGFAMQSFFIGTGAVIASYLPYAFTHWFGISNVAPEGEIPPSVKWSFYVGAFAFLSAVMWTVFRSKEYSPEQLKEYSGEEYDTKNEKFNFGEMLKNFTEMPKTMIQLAFVQFFSWFALFAMWIYTTNAVTSHIYNMNIDKELLSEIEIAVNANVPDESNDDFSRFNEIKEELADNKVEIESGKEETGISIKTAKFLLKDERQQLFNLKSASIERLTQIQKEYNDGADWVGNCFAVYNGFAAILAFFLMFMAKKTSRKITHAFSLVVGGISLASIYFVSSPLILLIPFIGIGLAWASILSMPYAILTGSLPANKMGVFMGIFNFFIVIPQIVAAGILGFFTEHLFGGKTIFALVLGGVSMIIAAVLVSYVKDDN